MKNVILSAVLFFVFPIFSVVGLAIQEAERQVPDGLEFEIIDNRSVTITGYIKNATTLNIPERIEGLPVTSIGDKAFFDCGSLINITIPSSVISIEDEAFAVCTGLTSITIPPSVISIGNAAFVECYNLTSINIPSSVTSIGFYLFSFCHRLTDITVDSQNPAYISVDGVLFDKDIQTIVIYPPGKNEKTYTIPSSVTSVRSFAFYNCDYLTTVIIPSSVTSIGDYAFYSCDYLTEITIPLSVIVIEERAFDGCKSLKSITLSRQTQVAEDAFPPSAQIIYRD